MRIKVTLGATRDGVLTAIGMEVLSNTGAYGNHATGVLFHACGETRAGRSKMRCHPIAAIAALSASRDREAAPRSARIGPARVLGQVLVRTDRRCQLGGAGHCRLGAAFQAAKRCTYRLYTRGRVSCG